MLGPNEQVAQVEINFDDNNKSTNPMLKFRKASLSEMMPEMKVTFVLKMEKKCFL